MTVPESGHGLPQQPPADNACSVETLLLGDGCYPGKRSAVPVANEGSIAQDKDLGMIWQRQIRVDDDPIRAVPLGVQPLRGGRCGNDGGPQDWACLDALDPYR